MNSASIDAGDQGAQYVFRTVRVMRGREDRALSRWRDAGWELESTVKGPLLRSEMTFWRVEPKRRKQRRGLWAGLIALLAIALVAAATQLPAILDDADDTATETAVDNDKDRDGLPDQRETAGWRTVAGRTFVTDARVADTDRDGLIDGKEAGSLNADAAGGAVYAGLSDPTEADSDGDGLDDASEFDGGLDPWALDSDGDELDDLDEIVFGSDPLIGDADGDEIDDAEERREGSDPNVYDLTGTQAAHAFTVAVGAGDWEWGAKHLGRLDDQQLTSWWYLAGSILRGIAPQADVTDIVANLLKGAWAAAFVSLIAILPVVGDGTKLTAAVAEFAKKGTAATRGALSFIARIPGLGGKTKDDMVRGVLRASDGKARLAQDLAVRGTKSPAPLPTGRPISKDPLQNALKDEKIAELQAKGFTDIRVNQQQVNAKGERVGINRPDIQATAPDGTRHNWEYDTTSSDRGPIHRTRIISNDDRADVCLLSELDEYAKCG